MNDAHTEMRLFDADGHRLYLNAEERERFMKAAAEEPPAIKIFCRVLHYTGCRPSEALELTPARINLQSCEIVIRSLKKRIPDPKKAKDKKGRKPIYRVIPVPERLIEDLDMAFDLRHGKRSKDAQNTLLWTAHRGTAWRWVKRVMDRAGITGPNATAKGLRHGFGVACVMAKIPLHKIRDWLGHTSTATTEIYTTVVGQDERDLLMSVWQQDEKSI